MRNKLLNAQEINRWANRRMNNLNRHMQRWSKDDPLPSGNVTIPKGMLSNDINTLQDTVDDFRRGKTIKGNPQASEVYLNWRDELNTKLDYAGLADMAKKNPEMVSFEDDLKSNNLTSNHVVHLGGYYNIHQNNVSADLVHKDAQKLGRLDTFRYGMFLENHPKFASAIDVVPAQVLRDYNHTHGHDDRNASIDNRAVYYDGQSVRKFDTNGNHYYPVRPSHIQLRARHYIRYKQVEHGQRLPISVLQGYEMSKNAKQNPNYNFGEAVARNPELAKRLNVEPGLTEIDKQLVYDTPHHRHINSKQLLERNRRYMVTETSYLLHQMDKQDSRHVGNEAVKQAEKIAKSASVNHSSSSSKKYLAKSRNGNKEGKNMKKNEIWNAKQIGAYADKHELGLENKEGALQEKLANSGKGVTVTTSKKFAREHAKWLSLSNIAHNAMPEPMSKRPLKAYASTVKDGSLATEAYKHGEIHPAHSNVFTSEDVDRRNDKLFKFSKDRHFGLNRDVARKAKPQIWNAERINKYASKHNQQYSNYVGVNSYYYEKYNLGSNPSGKPGLRANASAVKDGSFEKMLSNLSVSQLHSVAHDVPIKGKPHVNGDKLRRDLLNGSLHHSTDITRFGKNKALQKSIAQDKSHMDDPNYTINNKMYGLKESQMNSIDRKDLQDMGQLREAVTVDGKRRDGMDKPMSPEVNQDNMAPVKESYVLNMHPNLKTRMYLKTDPKGNVMSRTNTGFNKNVPFVLSKLDQKTNRDFKDLNFIVKNDNLGESNNRLAGKAHKLDNFAQNAETNRDNRDISKPVDKINKFAHNAEINHANRDINKPVDKLNRFAHNNEINRENRDISKPVDRLNKFAEKAEDKNTDPLQNGKNHKGAQVKGLGKYEAILKGDRTKSQHIKKNLNRSRKAGQRHTRNVRKNTVKHSQSRNKARAKRVSKGRSHEEKGFSQE